MENIQVAVIIGSTGLVGSEILRLLIEDTDWGPIKSLTRRHLSFSHPKVSEKIIDFDQDTIFEQETKGAVAFSALGTTLKQAGSLTAQRKVDFTYQLNFAKAAKRNGIENFVLISALGANSNSPFPYNKMKGELEEEIKKLGFNKLIIIRPSLLEGKRDHRRLGEEWGSRLLKTLPHLKGLESLRPTSGAKVAKSCLWALKNKGPGTHFIGPKEIWSI